MSMMVRTSDVGGGSLREQLRKQMAIERLLSTRPGGSMSRVAVRLENSRAHLREFLYSYFLYPLR